MKLIGPIALLALVAGSLGAQETEPVETWLVATTIPAEEILDPRAGVEELRRSELRERISSRVRSTFRHVDGLAVRMTESEARQLRRSPLVRWVERDLPRSISTMEQGSAPRTAPQEIPYGVSMVSAPGVWKATRGRTVRVGVIDTGVDRHHPDLITAYRGGRDFVNGDDDPQDDHGHGTHVAGTIAGLDNDFGVVGVAPEAEIYALKALNRRGTGTVESLIHAVEWAIDHDLDLINLSLGSPDSSLLEREVFDRARTAGVIAVAAAGNSYNGIDRLDYPAGYDSVISVGAIDVTQRVAGFSQRGSQLDFVAPGVAVQSTTFATYYGLVASDGAILRGEPMAFSPTGNLSGEYVDCGIGRPGELPSAVAGRIALIRRGELTFADKALNAKAAGATGVIIYNHHADESAEGGPIVGTLGSDGDWPITVGVSRSTGEHMLALSRKHVELGMRSASEYGKLNGTSMATPHVAGAIALLRALVPQATAFEIVEALRATAADLGQPGRDTTYGSGRIDVHQAALRLAPGSFGGQSGGESDGRRRSVRRP